MTVDVERSADRTGTATVRRPGVAICRPTSMPVEGQDWVAEAIVAGGGEVADLDDAEGLIWFGGRGPEELRAVLQDRPGVRWVQLTMAGVDRYLGVIDETRTWSSAKGATSKVVAELALAILLAGRRRVASWTRRRGEWPEGWSNDGGVTLLGSAVTIVGGGGIAAALTGLLQPFGAEVTIVRRSPDPVPGATRVIGVEHLHDALATADVVALCLALTPATAGIIGARELDAMRPDAWLVNVSRGEHVDTDALVAALRAGTIGGAALDVVDPEPLPADHPLWDLENCVLTPHIGTTMTMSRQHLAGRIVENVSALATGGTFAGRIDPTLGY